jgi:hypothetical protein
MTLEVQLNESETKALHQKAEALGQEFADYVGTVLRREARRPLRDLRQIAADIETRRGGPLDMSEDQVVEMLETAKHQMRTDRNPQAAQ